MGPTACLPVGPAWTMNAVAFDTHAAVRKLRAADLTEQQAETLVEVFSQVIGEPVTRTDREPFATRTDLAELETRLIKWMIGTALAVGALAVAVLRMLA